MTRHSAHTGRRWRTNRKLLCFSALFLPVLIGLGIWQLERAEQKEHRLQHWQIPESQRNWLEIWRDGPEEGLPVRLNGQYSHFSWLLDNRTRDGVPGYEVLTLFYPEAGPPVVVNRGWVRAPVRREVLPAFPTPQSEVQLQGRIADFPQPPVLDEDVAVQGWPRRVQTLGSEQAAEVEKLVANRVIRLDSPLQPGAFRADWQPDRMGPQTHYGYALQWFSLALVLLVLTLAASYRRPDRTRNTGADDDDDCSRNSDRDQNRD